MDCVLLLSSVSNGPVSSIGLYHVKTNKVQYVRTSAVIAQSGKAVLRCQHSCLILQYNFLTPKMKAACSS
jgi:hypothetical protein